MKYDTENMSLTNQAAKEEAKSFGMDPNSQTYQENCLKAAALYGDKAAEVAKKDLETAQFWFNKDKLMDDEIFKIGAYPLKTFVVKLNNGSLLLYAPVKIRNEVGFGSWLDSLGRVDWIVVASSHHTLNIQAVAERYPEAKIIGAPAAEEKLNHVNALMRKKFDYNCTDKKDMEAANSILEKGSTVISYSWKHAGTHCVL